MKKTVSALIWFLRTCFYNTPVKNWKLTAYLYAKAGRLLVGSDPFPVIECEGFKLKANGADRIVTAAVMNGNYEPYTLEIFRRLVKEAGRENGGEAPVFVDIGANIGLFTLMAASLDPGLKIFAFEPDPVSFRLLEENLELNEMKNVTVVHSAVGESSGTASLDVSSPQAGFHSIYSEGPQRLDVPVTALDDYFARAGLRPRLFKADVEGYEPMVLQGMTSLLQQSPLQFILEFNPEHLRRGGKAPEIFLLELAKQFDAIYCLDEIAVAALPYLPHDLTLKQKLLSVGYNLLLIRGEMSKGVLE